MPIFLRWQIQVAYGWTLNLYCWFGLQVQNPTIKQTSDSLYLKCEITTDYGPLVFEVGSYELIKNKTYQWRKWGGGGHTQTYAIGMYLWGGEERHPENMVLCCHICKHYNLGKGLEFLNAFPREGYICKASQWLRNRETSLKQTS